MFQQAQQAVAAMVVGVMIPYDQASSFALSG